jgi:hypothetical protein
MQMSSGPNVISKSTWMFARKNQKSGWRGGSMFGSEWKRRWVTLSGREMHMYKEDLPVEVPRVAVHPCRFIVVTSLPTPRHPRRLSLPVLPLFGCGV